MKPKLHDVGPPARATRTPPARARDVRRTCAAIACLVVLGIALSPWFDAAADRSFAAHMAQHMLLMYLAAPLLLFAWPARSLLRALPVDASRRVARAMRSRPLVAISHPLVAWLLFACVLWGTHFSPIYDMALASPVVHGLEHALFFSAAAVFWLPVIGPTPSPWRLAYPLRMAYVITAVPIGAFLGLALYQTTRVLYPHYVATQGSAAAAIADQHAGGALMWIAGGLVFFIAFMSAGVAWARDEQRLGRRIDEQSTRATVIPIASAASASQKRTRIRPLAPRERL